MKKTLFFFVCITFLLATSVAQEYIILEKNKGNELQSQVDIKSTLDIEYEFTTFNGFTATLTAEEYQSIIQDPRYEILPNHKFHTLLDNSIPLINANDSWNLLQNNTNLTGTHQTVCVIDTGVDYTHTNLGGCYGNNSVNSSCVVIGGYDFVNDDDDPDDDNGHGTHVTGIIVSNHSTYAGVAPNVKIIAIKALDAAGNGNSGDVGSGIDWCVANASKFNISVITMSLGSDTYYNTHCNGDFPTINNAVQSAVSNNISVIISSGNCENTSVYECYEGISGPACVSGAIPVGAVNDADSIWYQRGSLFQVLAPGRSIISTANGGGTQTRSGTSMAAPHVAGLVAILSQFYDLQSNNTFTNNTLVTTLNQTDTRINDTSGNNNTYPRINFLRALYSLDFVSPNITLISPANGTINSSQNQTFTLNMTDFATQNITFNLWNTTSLVNTTTQITTVQELQVVHNITNLSAGEYFWGAEGYDMNNNTFTTQNFTITIDGSTAINSPSNNTYTNQSQTNFSCTAKSSQEYALTNMTLEIHNTTSLIYNETTNISGSTNTSIFTYNLTNNISYIWNCRSYNNNSQLTISNNHTVTYDAIKPNVTAVSPFPTNETSDSTTKTFYFNASDNVINATCNLTYSGSSQASKIITDYSITNSLSKTLSPGNYTWKIVCTDLAGNTNESEEYLFEITEEESSSGSSGGEGGGGASDNTQTTFIKGSQNNPINSSDLQKGNKQTFTKGKKIYINDKFSQEHSITLNNIQNRIAQFTIQSDPINISVASGDVIKLNLSNKATYDLMINVTTVTDSLVIMTLTEINEPHPDYVEPTLTTQNNTQEENSTAIQKEVDINIWPFVQLIVILTILLILSLIIIWIYKKKFQGREYERSINKEIRRKAKEKHKSSKKQQNNVNK